MEHPIPLKSLYANDEFFHVERFIVDIKGSHVRISK